MLNELQVESCAVVGFSLGGMINRRFALDYQDRVSALVILNSPHERDPEEQRIIEKRVADTVQGGPEATLKSSIARWFTPEFCESRPDVIREIGSWIVSNDPFLYAQCREISGEECHRINSSTSLQLLSRHWCLLAKMIQAAHPQCHTQ